MGKAKAEAKAPCAEDSNSDEDAAACYAAAVQSGTKLGATVGNFVFGGVSANKIPNAATPAPVFDFAAALRAASGAAADAPAAATAPIVAAAPTSTSSSPVVCFEPEVQADAEAPIELEAESKLDHIESQPEVEAKPGDAADVSVEAAEQPTPSPTASPAKPLFSFSFSSTPAVTPVKPLFSFSQPASAPTVPAFAFGAPTATNGAADAAVANNGVAIKFAAPSPIASSAPSVAAAADDEDAPLVEERIAVLAGKPAETGEAGEEHVVEMRCQLFERRGVSGWAARGKGMLRVNKLSAATDAATEAGDDAPRAGRIIVRDERTGRLMMSARIFSSMPIMSSALEEGLVRVVCDNVASPDRDAEAAAGEPQLVMHLLRVKPCNKQPLIDALVQLGGKVVEASADEAKDE
jgi:hypothetical protein